MKIGKKSRDLCWATREWCENQREDRWVKTERKQQGKMMKIMKQRKK